MASSSNENPIAEIVGALEKLAGRQIDATPQQIEEQVRKLLIPVSNYDFTPGPNAQNTSIVGQVLSRSIVVVVPPSCVASELLDLSGFTVTSGTGNATLSLKAFLCPNEGSRDYGEPVNIVATAVSASPIFVTATHSLVIQPPNFFPTDVRINLFTWGADGSPAPNVAVNWRCRVPTSFIIS